MPAHRVPSDVILDALQLACRAPSLHNSQPWRWVVTADRVHLFADTRRLLRAADDSGSEALISCGAALHHFRVAMAAAGWLSTVRRFPDKHDRLHLATVEFTPADTVSDRQRRRADAILLRHSERLPLAMPAQWDQISDLAETVTETEVVRIDHVSDEDRPAMAEASRLANLLRAADLRYQEELASTIPNFSSREGIPTTALTSAEQQRTVDVGREFPAARGPGRHTATAEDRSTILILSTVDETPESVLRCGEALSAILLDATTAGMATCTVSHVMELPTGRDVVAALLRDRTFPQVLVRVGRSWTLNARPPATPRLPIDEVVEMQRGTA
ncbi:Acg family FMN-binding oxidoreductase [Mycolicibacterium vaccae]|uniref:Acg family FMN-binding oxidoreductase n=1 Tax=Mycolicibacterium vaccae TaxID=1810 RepID=UPI003CE9AFA0